MSALRLDDPLFGTVVGNSLGNMAGLTDPLKVASKLREEFGPELGRRAAELHSLRLRCKSNGDNAQLLFLTRKGLEQSTPWPVAIERAEQIRGRLGDSHLWDATCGLGSDLLAMARGGPVVGSDLDEETARCALANLHESVGSASVVQADCASIPTRRTAAVVLDPDRRVQGKRSLDPARWSPTLEQCRGIVSGFGAGCVKLPPAFDRENALEEEPLTWVSLRGELREVSLWLGTLAEDRPRREVVALGRGGRTSFAAEPVRVEPLDPEEAAKMPWMAEPDPGVIRSGLLGALAAQENLRPLAPRMAYLGGEQRSEHPLLRSWRVLETCSLDRKRVRAMLGEHGIGPLTVKKRGHPSTAEELAKKFAGPGSNPGLLAVCRLEKGHLALLLEGPEKHL